MKTPTVIKTAAFAILVFAWAWAAPARAQVRCDQPDQTAARGTTDAFEEEFTRKVTLPLINHDAGKLGPVLWTYIAGQAVAESLGKRGEEKSMQNRDGSFKEKPGLNLWNTQLPYNAEECNTAKHPDNPPGRTIVGCLGDNKNKPHAVSKEQANTETPCWYDAAEKDYVQFTKVCFPKYGTVEEAADKYVEFRPDYTRKLRELSADGRAAPSVDDFFGRLKNARWSNLSHTPTYQENTIGRINEALRSLARVRNTDQEKLKQVQEKIHGWCAQPGPGDAVQRQALQEEQSKLIDSLSTIARVCLSEGGGQAMAPTGNAAINDCRKDIPKPQQDTARPPSGSSQAPGGAAAGVGEPHYTLPSGAVLTTQRAGEFWLLDAARDFQVQVRHTPWQGSHHVAAITAVAVRVGRHRVSIYVDGTVRLEGQPLSWTGRFVQRDLGDGHALGIWGEAGRPSTVAVMTSDGRYLRVRLRSSWMDVGMYWPMDADSAADRGLAGASSSDAAGTLTNRDGRRGKLSNPDDVTAFVDSWRIEAKESLFDYAAGESSATFDRRDFPQTPANPSAEALAAARMTCEAAGVGPAQLGTCAFDVAVTGDAAFAQSHLQATQAMRHVLTTQSVAMQPPPAEPARGCDQNSDCGVGSVCDLSSSPGRCVKRKQLGEKCSSDVECHGGLGGTQRICADKEKVCADSCRTDWDCGTYEKCKISNGLCSLR